MNKIILITYYFPPNGGAGVQRALKFAKYLPEFGILPIIITRGISGNEAWSPSDKSLLDDVSTSLVVYRTRPNPAKLPAAKKIISQKARRYLGLRDDSLDDWSNEICIVIDKVLKEHTVAGILVTMSPFELCVPVAFAANKYNLPWTADLRDPWALDEFQVYPTRWHRWLECRRMRKLLSTASSIIMNTPEAQKAFQKRFPSLSKISVTSITNGYDAADFENSHSIAKSQKFTILHAGHFHTNTGLHQARNPNSYRILGRTHTGVNLLCRSHFYLLRALEIWASEEPDIIEKVSFIQIGTATASDIRLVETSPVKTMVEFKGYSSHEETIAEMHSAHLLFLPLHGLPISCRSTIVPGKTYEYLATRAPILAPVPEGDAKDFLLNSGLGLVTPPSDVASILHVLRKQYAAWKNDTRSVSPNNQYIISFERRNLTEALTNHLKEAFPLLTLPDQSQ